MQRQSAAPAPRLSTTMVMSLAAVVAALISIFGHPDSFTPLTVVMSLVGLIPWAIEAGGARLHPVVFLVLVLAPATAVVVVEGNPGGLFPVMLAIVWITRVTANPWIVGLTLASGVALTLAHAVLDDSPEDDGTIYFLGGLGVAWLAGSMLRRQELLVAELREAHAQQAEHAAAAERTRIAREVHDVVAHSLTVSLLHVAGARRALATDPERAAEALERAETVGRESLDSIRQTVGLLRSSTGDGADDAPLPALADIPGLVDQYRGAGLEVAADLQLDGISADPATELTAFRVVQEALSNVLQHAPGSSVDLRIASDHDGAVLRIISENPAEAHGHAPRRERTGLGLRGMTERVRAAGGSVDAGPTHHHTWRIEAALPLRRPPALAT